VMRHDSLSKKPLSAMWYGYGFRIANSSKTSLFPFMLIHHSSQSFDLTFFKHAFWQFLLEPDRKRS
jgi:hypothetical protein